MVRNAITFVVILILLTFFACKKDKKNNIPVVSIQLPIENATYNSIDTIKVKARVSDIDDDELRISIFITDEKNVPVSASLLIKNSGTIDTSYYLLERWLSTGNYYLVVSVSDGKNVVSARVKINIIMKPPTLKGMVVGVKNSSWIDVYYVDTMYQRNKILVTTNVIDGIYNSQANQLVILYSTGQMAGYQASEYYELYRVSQLNKIGSPYKGMLYWKYPYVYVTNANGSILMIDSEGRVRDYLRTVFSPYKFIDWNDQWPCLTDFYPQPYSWIELPRQHKNYQHQEWFVDIFKLDNERCLTLTKSTNEKITFYTYRAENNYLSTFGHEINGKFNGGIYLNEKLILSINQSLYEINPIYGTLYEIFNGLKLSKLKYEEHHHWLYATYGEQLYWLRLDPISEIGNITFTGDIIFYDFVYE